jgi:ankyrin repeat protein
MDIYCLYLPTGCDLCRCNGSHAVVVEMLLANPESIATVNEKTSKSGATALHCVAVSSGKSAHEIARALIAAGASVNARDLTGSTALS